MCTFSATGKLRKQVDGVSIGDTLSVTFSDCLMNKMERDIVHSHQNFYRANKISSGLEQKILIIKEEYLRVGYPNAFINSLI